MYTAGAIAAAIAKNGDALETFGQIGEDESTFLKKRKAERERQEEEYEKLMEIRRLVAENPDWLGQMEKEMHREEEEDARGHGNGDAAREEDPTSDVAVMEEKKKKKKRRRRKKKAVPEEEGGDEPSATTEVDATTVSSSSAPVTDEVESIKVAKKSDEKKRKKKTKEPLNIEAPSRTVYVGNLSFDVTERSLSEGLSKSIKSGKVERVYLLKNNKGRGAGFAYATFASETGVAEACEEGRSIVIDGRKVRISRFDPASLYRRTGKRKAKRRRGKNTAGA